MEALNLAADVLAAIPNPSPEEPPGGAGFLKILGWGAWIVSGLCVLGVFVVAGKMTIDNNNGRGGGEHAKALGNVLTGAIIASVASGIVGGVVAAAGGLA